MADRFGYQLIIRIGSVLLTASLIAASFATQLWQLYLSQGLLFGIGCGMIFLPTLSLPSQYFTTKRGVATGITAAGTGVGGLILSPITNALIQAIGFRWALRITAIITFVVVNIGTFFLKTRIVPRGGGGKLFDTEVLRDKRFYTLTVLVVFWSMGVMLPFFYLPTYAATAGLTTAQAATIVSVTNAFSAIGRVVNGYVADRLGRVNLLAVGTVIAGLSVLVIWLPAGSSFGVLIAFGIVFGFFSGGVIGLVPVVTSMIFGAERLASILGMVYLGWAVGTMTGNQVAGKIIDSVGRDGAHSFYGIIVLAGVSVFLGGMCGFVLRRMMTKKWRLII
ncbi:MFS general substrate transporter [Ramicandelaber brevisporus]|nr:MFS general substrate transporter [Ramicandelaber brevisporus]